MTDINFNMLKERKYKEVGIYEDLSKIKFNSKQFTKNKFIAPYSKQTLNYVLKRISDKIIMPELKELNSLNHSEQLILLNEKILKYDNDEILKNNKLESFNNENVSELVKSITKTNNVNMFKNDTIFKWLTDTNLSDEKHGIFITIPLKISKLDSWWFLKRKRNVKANITSISYLLSALLLFNELKNYTKKNQERLIFYLLEQNIFNKTIRNWKGLNIYYTEKEIEIILNKLNNKFTRNLKINPENPMLKAFTDFILTEDINILFEYGKQNLSTFYIFFGHLILNLYLEDSNNLVTELKIFSRENSDYANSYQDMKINSKEITEKAKSSRFNEYFKKVEFDPETDLEKVKIIEQDFFNFIKLFDTKLFNLKKITLRFRKLGKYNAQGLFFPYYNTIVVDPRNTNSFIHEFFHMIDFTSNERLSRSKPFLKLKKHFKTEMLKQLDLLDNDDFKIQWNGKTKYNKSYYLNDAELFARIGEIYIKRILNFSNNLIKIDESDINNVLYPNNKILETKINDFFNTIFQNNNFKIQNAMTHEIAKENVAKSEINKKIVISQMSIWDLMHE